MNQQPVQRHRDQQSAHDPGDTPEREALEVQTANTRTAEPQRFQKCHGIALGKGILTTRHSHGHGGKQDCKTATQQQESLGSLE